jgi:hypothetical protein
MRKYSPALALNSIGCRVTAGTGTDGADCADRSFEAIAISIIEALLIAWQTPARKPGPDRTSETPASPMSRFECVADASIGSDQLSCGDANYRRAQRILAVPRGGMPESGAAVRRVVAIVVAR